jgi:S-formylglutathione hydrolase FrmB
MAFCHVQWSSQVLGKQVGCYVILPDMGKAPYATFYLLHGLSDDYTMWQRRTRIEWYVRELPLIVVMPDGFRGFYTDNEEGPAYAKYLGEELPAFIEKTFPAKRTRSARCVGGLSMGGYGALRLGLGYPDTFASVNSHSGALMHGAKTFTKPEQAEFRRVFGAKPAGSNHDLLVLARKAKRAGKLPKLLIDCGTEDYLLADNREFHAKLDAMGVAHQYAEYPGAHMWDYWDAHIQDALRFHATNLRLAGKRK